MQSTNKSAWTTEPVEEDYQTLEQLFAHVDSQLKTGRLLQDILQYRSASQTGSGASGNGNHESPYSSYTSKGQRFYVGIRHLCTDLWDGIYYIARKRSVFPEGACRTIAVIESCLIHIGLKQLDLALASRPKVVQERLNAIEQGGKAKRLTPKLPTYEFVDFKEVQERQVNIYCLCASDYSRLAAIAEDFGWTLGFVCEITLIAGISLSEKLPEHLTFEAQEELRFFREYLDKALK